ncbi:hypothetical protein EDC04DRAFT_2598767 [Pisolithus marmoratus]|nr:hypothetical protein EDC04DRAFT_2598767 [Pisolithus marmoratus]
MYPAFFVKPIKNCFTFSTGAGLTAEELKANLQMRKLLDKILENFPWWEDIHGFWRTNPSYNMVFSTADPGQDFAAEAQQYFAGEKSTMAAMTEWPLVGVGWVNLSPSNEDPGVKDNEEFKFKDTNPHDDDFQASPSPGPLSNPPTSVDDNIDPLLQSTLSSIYGTDISPITSTTSANWHQHPPSTTGVLQALTSHAHQASAGNKGKTKAMDVSATSLTVPSHAPSSSGSSVACKQAWDVNSKACARISEASDNLICQIQNSSEAKTEIKWLRLQAEVISKELKAHDKNAQCEHNLKLKITENEHVLLMQSEKTKQASERTRQLELELRLEEVRLA